MIALQASFYLYQVLPVQIVKKSDTGFCRTPTWGSGLPTKVLPEVEKAFRGTQMAYVTGTTTVREDTRVLRIIHL
jgi:hypothetical protein